MIQIYMQSKYKANSLHINLMLVAKKIMDVIKKIKEKIDNKEVTPYKIAKSIGVNPSVISRILNGDTKNPSEDTIAKLENYLSGKGNAKIKAIKMEIDVPLVSQYAYGGFLSGFADEEYMDSLPTVSFEPTHEPRGNYVAFEVRGSSMDDDSKRSITHGDIVICREINKDLWKNRLHFRKWDYFVIVDGEEGIILKSIIDHNPDTGDITIHSLNPDPIYADKIINLSNIQRLYNVIEVRRRQ